MATHTILVVDDEPAFCRIAEVNLQRAGYDVAIARDGKQALDALRAEPERFSLVLMDVNMPRADGFAAMEEINADPTLKRIPVILLTAKGKDSDVFESRRLGVAAFLHKPLSPKELLGAVKSTIESGPPADPA